jgi:valyl-tRNA synthetase
MLLLTSPAKKEAKRLEKLAKAAAKGPVVQKQPSAKKEKKEEKKVEEPAEAWVNPTPKGEKKGEYQLRVRC